MRNYCGFLLVFDEAGRNLLVFAFYSPPRTAPAPISCLWPPPSLPPPPIFLCLALGEASSGRSYRTGGVKTFRVPCPLPSDAFRIENFGKFSFPWHAEGFGEIITILVGYLCIDCWLLRENASFYSTYVRIVCIPSFPPPPSLRSASFPLGRSPPFSPPPPPH